MLFQRLREIRAYREERLRAMLAQRAEEEADQNVVEIQGGHAIVESSLGEEPER